ncbi:MAG: ankyrin repeat domain-containing protein [Deltaproteobacteria bacterium]|nr:ankyrin repeat domain-containing protein [Deltaproteobacteria bacterium]
MAQSAGVFYHLRKSFTSLNYYRRFHLVPFKTSIKVFVLYCVILGLVVTTYGVVKYGRLSDFFMALPAALDESYPEGLEIKIVDGAVSTNSYEPLFIKMGVSRQILQDVSETLFEKTLAPDDPNPFPFHTAIKIYTAEEMKTLIQGHKEQMQELVYFNLLAIDTHAGIAAFDEYESLALLTKHHLITVDKDSALKAHSLSRYDNETIDRSRVLEWLATAKPFLENAFTTLVVGAFVGALLVNLVGYPLYLVILALILYGITKLLSHPKRYTQAYQVGLHLVMVTCTAETILYFAGLPIRIPFIETIALVVMGTLVLLSIEQETTVRETGVDRGKNPTQLRLEALYQITNALEVQTVIRNNKDLLRGSGGEGPLLHYTEQGNPGLVLFVLQMGADINFKNKKCESALHIAAREGHTNVVNILLDHGAGIDEETPRGARPIHFAAIFGHKQLARHLAEKGARVDFITAVSLGDFKTVKQLIAEDKAYVNLFSPAVGCNPLHCAVMEKNFKMVELLLENGARPDATDDEQLTPLIYAIRLGEIGLVKSLIHKGANKTLKDGLGHDALWWARQVGHLEIMQLLQV